MKRARLKILTKRNSCEKKMQLVGDTLNRGNKRSEGVVEAEERGSISRRFVAVVTGYSVVAASMLGGLYRASLI